MLKHKRESAEKRIFDFLSRDVLLAFALIFMFLWIVLMNPPAQKSTTDDPTPPPGNLLFEMFYTGGGMGFNDPDPDTGKPIDVDADIWVRCGENERPVGWSNRSTRRCDYLRDDLGTTYDPHDPINYEFVVSRGLVAGQYCVNTYWWSNRWGKKPVKFKVRVWLNKGGAGANAKTKSTLILEKEGILEDVGSEVNVFCFYINEKGEYEKDRTFQSDAICLYRPLDPATGRCAPFLQQGYP